MKQELESKVLAGADIVVTDSLSQCQERGEIYQALKQDDLDLSKVIELGSAIESGVRIRLSDDQVTVADLTGVAVQDVQIAKAVCHALAADSN